MDPAKDLHLPLKPDDARKLARHIVEYGTVAFSSHAEDEMEKDDLETPDCLNVLRGGVYSPPELINGELRYRVSTQRMTFVVVFRSHERIRVVTGWRNR